MCYRTGKCTVFEACPWFFQPGNSSGWGSEGVKDFALERPVNLINSHHTPHTPWNVTAELWHLIRSAFYFYHRSNRHSRNSISTFVATFYYTVPNLFHVSHTRARTYSHTHTHTHTQVLPVLTKQTKAATYITAMTLSEWMPSQSDFTTRRLMGSQKRRSYHPVAKQWLSEDEKLKINSEKDCLKQKQAGLKHGSIYSRDNSVRSIINQTWNRDSLEWTTEK